MPYYIVGTSCWAGTAFPPGSHELIPVFSGSLCYSIIVVCPSSIYGFWIPLWWNSIEEYLSIFSSVTAILMKLQQYRVCEWTFESQGLFLASISNRGYPTPQEFNMTKWECVTNVLPQTMKHWQSILFFKQFTSTLMNIKHGHIYRNSLKKGPMRKR